MPLMRMWSWGRRAGTDATPVARKIRAMRLVQWSSWAGALGLVCLAAIRNERAWLPAAVIVLVGVAVVAVSTQRTMMLTRTIVEVFSAGMGAGEGIRRRNVAAPCVLEVFGGMIRNGANTQQLGWNENGLFGTPVSDVLPTGSSLAAGTVETVAVTKTGARVPVRATVAGASVVLEVL